MDSGDTPQEEDIEKEEENEKEHIVPIKERGIYYFSSLEVFNTLLIGTSSSFFQSNV